MCSYARIKALRQIAILPSTNRWWVRFDAGCWRHGSRTLPLGGRLQLGFVKGWPGRLWTNAHVDRYDGIIRVECDFYLAEPRQPFGRCLHIGRVGEERGRQGGADREVRKQLDFAMLPKARSLGAHVSNGEILWHGTVTP